MAGQLQQKWFKVSLLLQLSYLSKTNLIKSTQHGILTKSHISPEPLECIKQFVIVTRGCCTNTGPNTECDKLERIIDQPEITNGFLHRLCLKIYGASGYLLGFIDVCNAVNWEQNTVLIIYLHFNPLFIDFHSGHAPPDKRHRPPEVVSLFQAHTGSYMLLWLLFMLEYLLFMDINFNRMML